MRIFISYRRGPTTDITGRIHDRLEAHFGHDSVFRDVDNIPPGVRFADHLEEALENCDLVLAIIGPDWVTSRLDNPQDFLRRELEFALSKGITIIPVLVGGASIPSQSSLNSSLTAITEFQAAKVGSEGEFGSNLRFLIKSIEGLQEREQRRRQKEQERLAAEERRRRVTEEQERSRLDAQKRQQAEEQERIRAQEQRRREAEEQERIRVDVLGQQEAEERERQRVGSEQRPQPDNSTFRTPEPGKFSDYAMALEHKGLFSATRARVTLGVVTLAAGIGGFWLIRAQEGTPHRLGVATAAYNNLKREAEQSLEACNRGDKVACTNLGVMYTNGIGVVKRDEKRAVDLYQQACDGGEMTGCYDLGVMYANGAGLDERDNRRAVYLYQKACEGDEMSGCVSLGWMYANGNGVDAIDEKHAVELYQQACDGGEMMGCYNLGWMYANGIGVDVKDEGRAVYLYQQACDGGFAQVCTNIGLVRKNAAGVAQ